MADDGFDYPFPKDPGAAREVAKVVFAVRLKDGRTAYYAGHATKASFEALAGSRIPSLDINSPTGVAQAYRTVIDWVSGTVRRMEDLPIGWAQIPEPEQPAIDEGPKEIGA